jgi:hypothetical protein
MIECRVARNVEGPDRRQKAFEPEGEISRSTGTHQSYDTPSMRRTHVRFHKLVAATVLYYTVLHLQ